LGFKEWTESSSDGKKENVKSTKGAEAKQALLSCAPSGHGGVGPMQFSTITLENYLPTSIFHKDRHQESNIIVKCNIIPTL